MNDILLSLHTVRNNGLSLVCQDFCGSEYPKGVIDRCTVVLQAARSSLNEMHFLSYH